MSRGLRRRWEKGERIISANLKGKKGGKHVDHAVTLVLEPKARP